MSNIVRFNGRSNHAAETPASRMRENKKNNSNSNVTSTPATPAATTCVICAEDIINFAISNCTPSHPVCSKCMTRLRFLQKDNRCPVCRSELVWVLFASKLIEWDTAPFNAETNKNQVVQDFFEADEVYKIVFESKQTYDEFLDLTTIKCKICDKVVRTDDELVTHLRKMHDKKVCDICLHHLHRFPCEYVYYDRAQLAVHNKTGDKGTLGLKGHPLCEFCQKRFLDTEELETHQRREHYYCHFCADQGFVEFFEDPYILKNHYKKYHILCEEGDCANDYGFFTSVFNNDFDYQAHRLKEHGKSYSKKIRDQLKQIPLHFETPYSRSSQGSNDRRRGGRHGGAGSSRGDRSNNNNEEANGFSEAPGMTASSNDSDAPLRFTSSARQQDRRTRYDRNREHRQTDDISTDSQAPGSDRGFFEVSHPPLNRPEGVPLSEQHKITTIAANVPSENRNRDPATEVVIVKASDGSQFNHNSEDFPDLAGNNSKSTSFWSSFDHESMKGIDRMRETHFPALPQADGPSSRGKNKKLSANMNKSSPWSSTQNIQSNEKAAPNTQPSTELSSISDSLTHQLSLSNQSSGAHPNYMVVRPKTKSAKKKKKQKNDSDETLNSIKGILSSVNTNSADETDGASGTTGDEWKPFEKDAFISSAANHEDSSSPAPIEFHGMKLRPSVEDSPNHQPKSVNSSSADAPPGFSSVPKANLSNGASMAPKQPILDLPPGFEFTISEPQNRQNGHSTEIEAEEKEDKSKTYEYFYPEDFDVRNRKLNAMIHQLLVNRNTGDEKLYHDFTKISKSFSRGQGSANAVLNFCKFNFGDNFYLIFNEVLCLLPSISCQRKLIGSFLRPKNGVDKVLEENLTHCVVCKQVLAHKDKLHHYKNAHGLDESSPKFKREVSFSNLASNLAYSGERRQPSQQGAQSASVNGR